MGTVSLINKQYHNVEVKGAIFDSAQGPGTLSEFMFNYFGAQHLIQGKSAPLFYYFGIAALTMASLANKVPLGEVLNAIRRQQKAMKLMCHLNRGVPWCGSYLRDEAEGWPLLFLYSRVDWQIPYRFIEHVV